MERPIEEVAAELIVLRELNGSTMFANSCAAYRLTVLYEELVRRCGVDNTKIHLDRAQQSYDLLAPPKPPPSPIRGKSAVFVIIDDLDV